MADQIGFPDKVFRLPRKADCEPYWINCVPPLRIESRTCAGTAAWSTVGGATCTRAPAEKPAGDFHLPLRPGEERQVHGAVLRWREDPRGLNRERLEQQPLTLRSRQGGERLRIHAQGPHRQLKKLYQEAGIPPWERELRPLLFAGEELIAVPGLFLDANWLTQNDRGLRPEWKPPK